MSHKQQDMQQVTITQIYTTVTKKIKNPVQTTQHKSPLHINSSSAH